MTEKFHKKILIDVGSSNIKIVTLDNEEIIRDYIGRNYEIPVGEQVLDQIIKLKKEHSNSKIRISSSANGGLRVGLISITKRYSGEIARRIILQAGCNLIWHLSDTNHDSKIVSNPLDVIVISGGLNVDNCDDQELWIDKISKFEFLETPIIFCGNKFLRNRLENLKKNLIITDNVIEDNMKIKSENLKSVLRELYMLDLIQKDGISMLQEYSEVPIWPTPSICEIAFKRIIENKTKFKIVPPLMIVDLGGATTDVFYGREIIKNLKELESEALSTNRFVFSSIGVQSSKTSTLSKLNKFNKLFDLINCFSKENSQKKYIDFKENKTDWISNEEMFYLCFGLVLDSLKSGDESGHPISLSKINFLIITGGASQVCNVETLNEIYTLFHKENEKHSTKILLDKDYEIWNLGLMSFKI